MDAKGKTTNIINRFPHFFDESNTESLFYQLVSVFAEILEETEIDLLRVMRSHHIDTANNYGSQGFDARKKGDLDKIFTLYLEKLGGTSQLIQIEQDFNVNDINNISAFVRQILNPNDDDSVSQYIFNNLGDQHNLFVYFNDTALRFEDFKEPNSLIIKLIVAKDPWTLYLQEHLCEETKEKIKDYNISQNVPSELLYSLAKDFNNLIEDPQLYRQFQQRSIQFNLAFTLNKIINESLFNQQETNKIINILGQIIRHRLSLKLQNTLYENNQEQLTSVFWEKVIIELKDNLGGLKKKGTGSKVYLCQQLLNLINEFKENPQSTEIKPSDELFDLLDKTLESLKQLLGINSLDKLNKNSLSKQVKDLFSDLREKDNLKRGNRLLLEIVYENEISKSNIPLTIDVKNALIIALNENILSDTNFYQENYQYFDNLMLDIETQNLIKSQQTLQKEQIKRLNRLLLETAYPLYIQKSYNPYRERLKALIKVIRKGAATKQGIKDIVAANLGIFDDKPEAKEAKKRIIIEEYSPEFIQQTFNILPLSGELDETKIFTINNPNLEETTPISIQIQIKTKGENISIPPLSNLFIINSKTQQVYLTYQGQISANKILLLEKSGKIFYESIEQSNNPRNQLNPLPPEESSYYFQAKIGEVEGKFDETLFNFSSFDESSETSRELTIEQANNFDVEIIWELEKKNPGTFRVNIPWDIPGFSDKFNEVEDHPRSQIQSIINKVKAAGVFASFVYDKYLKTENHEIEDRLAKIIINPLHKEQHQLEDNDLKFELDIHSNEHQISDLLLFEGRFDYLSFDWSIFAISSEEFNQDFHELNELFYGTIISSNAFLIEHNIQEVAFFESQLFQKEEHDVNDSSLTSEIDQSSNPTVINHEISDMLLFEGIFDGTQFNVSTFS